MTAGRRTRRPPASLGGPARRLLLLLIAILLVFSYGVVGYMLLGFGFIDALYMTSLALTTAGFTPAGDLDGAAKVFTVTIAVLGVSAFLAVLGVLTTALTDRQFIRNSRRRRMDKRIEKLRGHHVVCAYGRVGRTVAREFEGEGIPFVVIDAKEDLEGQMQEDGVPYILGDPASPDTLRRSGIERARALLCALDSDAANVYIALTARSLNPDLFIVARAGEPGSAELLFRAGADRVISPYVTSGRHMALVSLRPRVVDFFEVVGLGGKRARLDELSVRGGISPRGPNPRRRLWRRRAPAAPAWERSGGGQPGRSRAPRPGGPPLPVRGARGPAGHRGFGRVRLLAPTLTVALLLSACTGAAPTIEEVTIVNGTAYDLEVEIAAEDGDGWLPLARVGAGTEGSALEVIDQGDAWVFRFRHWGQPVGEVMLTRGELEEIGWSVEVPGEIAERLEDLGRPTDG